MSRNSSSAFVLSDAQVIALSVVNVVFSIGGSLGNIMVCVAYLTHRNLRSIMNIFILSLALSDLIVCLVAQPMFVTSLIKRYQQQFAGNLFEDVRKRLTWISLLASAGNLFGVTVDRYLAISSPLRYSVRMTIKKAYVMIFLLWAIALGLGSMIEANALLKFVGVGYVVVLVVFFISPLYCHVLWIARKHARVIQSVMSHMAKFQGRYPNTTTGTQNDEGLSTSIVRKADKNSLKTVGIISSIFIFGWFPLLVLPVVYRTTQLTRRNTVLLVFQWVNTLALCSAACNPVVYSWRDRRFRKAMLTTYTRWSTKRVIGMPSRVNSIDTNRTSLSVS